MLGVVICWSCCEPQLQAVLVPESGDGLILGRDLASEMDDRISRRHSRVRSDGQLEQSREADEQRVDAHRELVIGVPLLEGAFDARGPG